MELTGEERQLVLTSLWLFRTRIVRIFSQAPDEDMTPEIAEKALGALDLIESTVAKMTGDPARPGYPLAE